jgi:TusA-related sulfurtransferase
MWIITQLMKMDTGEVIHILLGDVEVVDLIKKIVGNSEDEIIEISQEDNHFKLSIRKGPPCDRRSRIAKS